MRSRSRLTSLAAVVLAATLGGCADDTAGAAGAPADTGFAAMPGDAALTCQQIGAEITRQNVIIKNANATNAASAQTATLTEAGNPNADPTSQGNGMVPGAQPLTPEQREAAHDGPAAVARANALIALGRQKHCFQ